jgi:hypothetical protein
MLLVGGIEMTARGFERRLTLPDGMNMECTLAGGRPFRVNATSTPCGVCVSVTEPASLPSAVFKAALAAIAWAEVRKRKGKL